MTTRVSTQVKFRTDRPEFKTFAYRRVKEEMAYELGKLVLENTDGIICISPIKFDELFESDGHLSQIVQASTQYDFARTFPVYITEGYAYRNEPVRPPNSLSWWERIKFIFTGNYPK